MSEELLQRDLITNPQIIGKWNFYNIGSTSISSLKKANIINRIGYEGIEKRKPDGLLVFNKNIFCVIENKSPSELASQKKINVAISQALDVSMVVKAKLAIITDTITTIWVNGLTGELLLDEDENPIVKNFNPSDPEIPKLLYKIESSINQNNSQLRSGVMVDPTPLAKQIWQDIWSVSGATPENCLYTFVEFFIFKYLSDLGVLKNMYSFDFLLSMYENQTNEQVLKYYADIIRREIKDQFPKSTIDNTTIINGTIFVSKDNKAVEGYSGVFKKILLRFKDFGKLEKIDFEFKSKLFESFLKESISKKNWGQFFTPIKVVKPMVKMADIKPGMSICDPACGVGKFLLEAILPNLRRFYKVESSGEIKSTISLHGFDKGFDTEEQKTIILAKANMLIYFSDLIKEHSNATKAFADLFNNSFILKTNSILGTLRDPTTNNYDLILTNPPYVTSGSSNLKDEIKKDLSLDSFYKTNGMGVEGLFMEWIIRALKPEGKGFIVIPDGLLIRLHDARLRSFLMENCIIDAIISLPLNTFFTTNKKTYILAITKKHTLSYKQTEPVFNYLVSDIGETLDINRFDTDENQIENAVYLFNQFKGAKEYFQTNDKRCKVIDINFYFDNLENGWLIDKLWTDEEKHELGIIEKIEKMSISEFGNLIGEMAEELSEYQTLFNDLDKKKSNEIEIRKIPLVDLFDIKKGKSEYTKNFGNLNKGKYPVFSASNDKPLTSINSYDYDGKFLTWSTNGFAGYIKIIDGKFSINGDRGILIPKVENLHLGYIRSILQPKFRNLAKGRKGEKGQDEFTKVYPSMIKNVEVEIPITIKNNKFSTTYQKNYYYSFNLLEEFFERCDFYKRKINSFKLSLEGFENKTKFYVKNLFKIYKGKSKYTNKYIINNKGDYPVYSSQTNENGVIGHINSYDFDNECLTWTTDGIHAGTVFYRNGKFSMTTHCGALILKKEFLGKLNIEYLGLYLKLVLKDFAVGEQNKRVTKQIIQNIFIEIPIDEHGNFDLEIQQNFVDEFNKLEKTKDEIISKIDGIKNIEIHLPIF